MSNILSPEGVKQELEGGLELTELSELLEQREEEETADFDLVYSKNRNRSSDVNGSIYELQQVSEWYEDPEMGDVEVEDLEIDVQEIRMNAVTGDTLLIDSEGNQESMKVYSSFEGTTTFTQDVGRNTYVFRYDHENGDVEAVEVGAGGEPSRWAGEEFRKKIKLVDEMYHQSRQMLWDAKAEDGDITPHNSKLNHLRPAYNWVRQRIDRFGEAKIRTQSHVGSARGGNIKKNFKKAVRRHPEDTLDNYNIERDGNEYPIIIEEE